jgi:hypothetical protein
MTERQSTFVRELRTPRAAAVAGILFAVLLSLSIVLIQWSLPDRGQPSEWLTDGSRRRAMAFAIGLVPYAGIAFLWFIGVIRSRLGAQEDKFFATAFLGSGLLFIAMMFTAAALTGAVLDLYGGTVPVSPADTRLMVAVVASLLGTFGIRMAAVFTLVVTNLGRRTGFVPGWLVVIGYATAAVMLLAPTVTVWTVLLFPGWVCLLSINMLMLTLRSGGR